MTWQRPRLGLEAGGDDVKAREDGGRGKTPAAVRGASAAQGASRPASRTAALPAGGGGWGAADGPVPSKPTEGAAGNPGRHSHLLSP